MEFVTYEEQNQIGLLTYNRPKAMNALNSQVVAEASSLLEKIAESDIRCLVITGAGEKAFVAGADIAEMKDLPSKEAQVFSETGNRMMELIENLPMPVIAAVNGFALGGGCEIALSCDIRISSDRGVFGLPEVGLGIMPGYGGVQRLVRTVGAAKAKEMAFTTRNVKAEEALAIGLVNQVVPAEELMDSVMKMAQRIAGNAPFGVRAVKEVANKTIGLSVEDGYRIESELFGQCFSTEDQAEGMAAFLEKRKHEPYTGKSKG
ncbi:enoyl-CoA hydratase/isomerase family protein [Enterococcus sp. HY326]|uniref:enoyl-CoA hydratase/isomerase family protein n=1 Tax=Enterococcus sp. HY326 TaxID=2971265 RepID=UPI00223F9E8C|nr:enoyl-CoA hydratase-related protein [Enterococcus sp. HY326]